MQTKEKFCEVFALKFASFLCLQNRSALFAGRASTFMVCSPPNVSGGLLICERKLVEKPQLESPCRFINVKHT